MKSSEIIQPTPISAPIAHEGLKFNIPENPTGSALASIAEGFPEITMKALDDGGLPPRGQDCNGMFYLSTDQKAYLQNGGIITFTQSVSDLIGGYPSGAYLDYINSDGIYTKVKSLIDDNTYNFVTNPEYIDGEKWEEVNLGANQSLTNLTPEGEKHFLGERNITNCILEAPENPVTFSGNQITLKSGVTYLTSMGRNEDQTLKSNKYTTEQDYTITAADSGVLFISPNNNLGDGGILHRAAYYYEQSTPPTIDFTPVMLWRNPDENKNYYAWKNGNINEWTEIECTVLNRYIFADGAVQSSAPLNPIQVADAKDLDGVWTRKNKYIVQSLNVSGRNEYTYNLSDYLPNDGNVYEVMFSVIMDTGTTAGNLIEGTIRDSVLSITAMLGRCVTRTASTNILNHSVIIPMASRNIITMFNGNGQIGWLQAAGYRKVR